MKIASSSAVAVLLSAVVTLLHSQSISQDTPKSFLQKSIHEVFYGPSPDSILVLSVYPAVENSDSLILNGSHKLERGLDYVLRAKEGAIAVQWQKLRMLSPLDDTLRIDVFYRVKDFPFRNEYRLHKLEPGSASFGDSATTERETPSVFSMDDVLGTSLKKSGSLFRGFSLGSNRDLSLQSGFRLQLEGKISDELDVVAALSDENSPIQPEGTTQQLQELDRVFIQIKRGEHSATLGDFNIDRPAREAGAFGRVNRKVQGARGVVNLDQITSGELKGEVMGAAATNRGKYHTAYFQGLEGTQGPFRLTGQNGERQIIIISGTERVYLNGEEMARGETNDYIVDYASGEVFFTSNRLITNASRITIDFEYTDRNYGRNLLAGSTNLSLLEDRVRVRALAMRESDDRDNPIELSLNEELKQILSLSGADRLRASMSGIRFVGVDSLSGIGKGQYARVDTTIDGEPFRTYRYLPGNVLAVYSITFSSVSHIPPDSIGYRRIKIGHFEVVGKGKGEYLPIQLLPLPSQHEFLDVGFEGRISSIVSLEGEIASSRLNTNTFSSLPGVQQSGIGYRYGLRVNPRDLSVGGVVLGEIDATFSERFAQERFLPPDRFNEVEFDRKWDAFGSTMGDELIREGHIKYNPTGSITLGAGYGSLKRGNTLGSERWQGDITLADPSVPTLNYVFEEIASQNEILQTSARWTRHSGKTGYDVWVLRPSLRFESEKRVASSSTLPGPSDRGFRIFEVAPRIETKEIGRLKGSAEIGIRTEDSTVAEDLKRAFFSLTQRYVLQAREWHDLSGMFSLNLRQTEFTEDFKKRGNADSDIMLLRVESRYTPFERAVSADAFYEFSNQRSARFERVFVRVSMGTGNYRYRGDLNGNGLADENEFELTRFDGEYIVLSVPGDELVPVIDLKASTRIRVNVGRLMGKGEGSLAGIMKALSMETYLRVDEKSTDPYPRNIYLLKWSSFQNEATTLRGGNQVTQDVHVFESSPDLSLRFRYDQRRGFLKLVSSIEGTYSRERSIRMRWQPIRVIGNQTDVVFKNDRSVSSNISIRDRELGSTSLLSDFFYRPEREWEIGFKIGLSSTEDTFEGRDLIADLNIQGIRVVYAFLGRGQLRIEADREEVVVSGKISGRDAVLPFEFTGGRAIGKTYLLQIGTDYRLNQNLQVTLQYLGRSERGQDLIHSARVEARAFF